MAKTASESILNPGVLARLDEMVERHKDLVERLSDPDVIANPSAYTRIAKEQGTLARCVEKYVQLQRILEQRGSTEEMLATEEDGELLKLAQDELADLDKRQEELCEQIQEVLLEDEETGSRNVIMEIRAGTGGDEAGLFAMELLRMYERFASKHGWKVEAMQLSCNEIGGLKEGIISVQGQAPYKYLKFESGTHRVQRIPVTEASGRIHTSAATVAVLLEPEEIDIQVSPDEIKVDTYGASGPGGQHVNKTSSAVRITHIPTGIVVACQDERSQHKNRSKAMRVLRARLYDIKQKEQASQRAQARRSMVGTGDRSEKIRTYNFPQDRLTDHRINFTIHGLERIMLGELDPVINALMEHERIEKLKNFDRLMDAWSKS